MISNLSLSDSIEHLKLTPLVASRLRYYGATTIEDLLQLSHQVPRTNIADPALREIHALIDKVRKALVDVDSSKLDNAPTSSDQALVGESWLQASEGAVVTDEDIPSQGATEAESSQRRPGVGESSQPLLNSLGFGSVAARKNPLLLSDPVEVLHPPSWVIKILKQHSVDTVEALLRLPLSGFSTDPGSGTKTIEALIKKARHALSVSNEGRADSPTPGLGFVSPSDGIDRVPEDSADSQCESGVEVKKTLGIETLGERERDTVSVGNNNDEAPANANSWTGLGAEVCPSNQPNKLAPMSDRSSEESIEEIAVDSRCPTDEMIATLDQPWDEVLVLPGFVANGLHRAGLKTLREVITSSQGSELLTVRGFGNHAMRSLRWAIRKLKPELVSLCLGQPASPDPSPIRHEDAIGHVSTSIKRFLTHEDSIEHLKLSSLEIKILAKIGVTTVRDL